MKMILRSALKLSTKAFTWDATSLSFVAESSELNGARVRDRIYDDACDEGFILVSHVTGKAVPFAFSKEERDSEGEVVGWRYVPAHNGLFARGITLLIIND